MEANGSPFSLTGIIQNVQNVFQTLVGSFVGSLRRLGFGVSKMLGVGGEEETKRPAGGQKEAEKEEVRTDIPRGARVIDTSSMSPSEVAF